MHSPIDTIIVNHSLEFVKIFFGFLSDFFPVAKRDLVPPFVSTHKQFRMNHTPAVPLNISQVV